MKTIKNILVPIDLSENNQKVLKLCTKIAGYSDARIVMLHIYARPLISNAPSMLKNDLTSLARLERYKLLKRERSIANDFRELYNSVPELKMCRVKMVTKRGLIVPNIVKACKKYNTDLVIMGTHGSRSRVRRHHSNTAKVSLRAHTPVLVVPFEGYIDVPSKIAFTYDLKKVPDFHQLDIIKVLSLTYRAEIHLISVNIDQNKLSPGEKKNLAAIKEYFIDFEPKLHFIAEHNMKLGISEYARKNKINMLAVLHRSRNAFQKVFHRSLTKRLALHSTIPVLALEAKNE